MEHAKNIKGHNSAKNVDGVTFSFSAHFLIVVYTEFHGNIFADFKVIQRARWS